MWKPPGAPAMSQEACQVLARQGQKPQSLLGERSSAGRMYTNLDSERMWQGRWVGGYLLDGEAVDLLAHFILQSSFAGLITLPPPHFVVRSAQFKGRVSELVKVLESCLIKYHSDIYK